MAQRIPMPGKVKPTAFQVQRRADGPSHQWDWQPRGAAKRPTPPGVQVCPRCHAIHIGKRWFLDEPRFRAYLREGSAAFTDCPGCRKVDRRQYDGEVVLRSPLLGENKRQALHMIRRLEERARTENPLSRIGVLHDRGDEVGVLTTDTWLARRIGREFQRAFGGDTTYRWSRAEKAVRVRWERTE